VGSRESGELTRNFTRKRYRRVNCMGINRERTDKWGARSGGFSAYHQDRVTKMVFSRRRPSDTTKKSSPGRRVVAGDVLNYRNRNKNGVTLYEKGK